jgi:beta-lactamase regulating signal transducer with metallopeptidase domain
MSDWLVSTFLAATGLIVAVLLVREAVRERFGSRIAYGLWLIPAARLFMPTLTHTVERTVAATPPPGVDTLAAPVSFAAAAAPQPTLLETLGGWPSLLLALWLSVAAALFLTRLVAYHRDRRAILASAVEVESIGSVRIVRSAEVPSPIALGIFDRLVVVPADFERLYSARERRLVIEHELAHHRSGDLVANLFAFVLLCLQWFNPLAWVAHTAFRFDQEAACDARVLDKVSAGDRAAYGCAIAKAASGRALLFASTLGRPNTLKRRLKSMLRTPKPARSIAGKVIIVGGIAIALPLTASYAVDYVDVPAAPVPAVHESAAVAPRAAVAPAVPAALVAAAAPVPVTAPVASRSSRMRFDDNLSIEGDFITIDGQRKRWEDLTPAEKARVREAVARARTEVANVHIDRERIMRSVQSIPSKVQMEKIQRDVAQAQANVAESMRKLEAQRDELRRVGFDPSMIEAQMQQAMKSVRSVDMQAVQRSVSAIDPAKIAQSVDSAQRGVEAARAELDRLQARIDADTRQ